jgi:hypothetical protein
VPILSSLRGFILPTQPTQLCSSLVFARAMHSRGLNYYPAHIPTLGRFLLRRLSRPLDPTTETNTSPIGTETSQSNGPWNPTKSARLVTMKHSTSTPFLLVEDLPLCRSRIVRSRISACALQWEKSEFACIQVHCPAIGPCVPHLPPRSMLVNDNVGRFLDAQVT